MIGEMDMPPDFAYRDVFRQGPPEHQPLDAFRLKHPSMENGRRAKIFAPFDALAGFDDAVAAREVLYEPRRELSGEEQAELNRRLNILRRLIPHSRAARELKLPLRVVRFVPCADPDSGAFGFRGRCVPVSGVCLGVSGGAVRLDCACIPLSEIISLESGLEIGGRNVFDDGEVNLP